MNSLISWTDSLVLFSDKEINQINDASSFKITNEWAKTTVKCYGELRKNDIKTYHKIHNEYSQSINGTKVYPQSWNITYEWIVYSHAVIKAFKLEDNFLKTLFFLLEEGPVLAESISLQQYVTWKDIYEVLSSWNFQDKVVRGKKTHNTEEIELMQENIGGKKLHKRDIELGNFLIHSVYQYLINNLPDFVKSNDEWYRQITMENIKIQPLNWELHIIVTDVWWDIKKLLEYKNNDTKDKNTDFVISSQNFKNQIFPNWVSEKLIKVILSSWISVRAKFIHFYLWDEWELFYEQEDSKDDF